MSAKLILRKKEYEVPSGITILEALLQLGISPEAVLPTRKGELADEDDILKEGDVIRLVRVISGG
jgi:sulfur carrier protein ThiS